MEKRQGGLIAAAFRHFGSWKGALMAAGVPVMRRQSKISSLWTRERILETLRKEAREKRDLRSMRVKERIPELVNATRRVFGGWRAALREAGVRIPRRIVLVRLVRRCKWTGERVLDTIREAWNENCDIRINSLLSRHGASGTPQSGTSADGGPPSKPRGFPWSRDLAIRDIRGRISRS